MESLKATFRGVFQLLNRLPRLAIVGIAVVVIFAFLAFAGFLVYVSYETVVNSSKADTIQKDLENEFKQIAPPPNSQSIRYGSMHKVLQGEVGSDYRSSANYDELRSRYDKDLNLHGWNFIKEESVKIWGKDHGGKQVFYCKGPYTATLEYAGDAENQMGWTFSFGLSWGLFDECK